MAKKGTTKLKGSRDECDMTAGEAIVKGLTGLRESLKAGERLEERFTMRTVDLDLEPQAYDADDVRRVREKLKASQSVFARLLGVSVKTVQSWEQGLAVSPMARRLLDEIDRNPDRWIEILRQAVVEKQTRNDYEEDNCSIGHKGR